MAICINQAHAHVESARGADKRLRRAGEAHVWPRGPPRGALNRFFTILCMLQYVQAPSPRVGRDSATRSSPHPLPFGPGLGGQSRGDRGRQGQGGQTQTCGVGVGHGQPPNKRARSEGRGGDEADTFRDASNK